MEGGEGGTCVLDISDGHWASISRIGSVMSVGDHLGSSWSNFVHDIAPNRTSCWQGPNKWKIFLIS